MSKKERASAFACGLVWVLCLTLAGVSAAQPLRLVLPTSNDALLQGDGPAFYQPTDRNFEGRQSAPWQAGQYGFVRNPVRSEGSIVYTRFHEGLDIKPVYRDGNGEPLDTVRAIDAGRVVYVNDIANASSYGKYVVVEHWWSGAPFYSLYAHLGAVHVREGQRVRPGDRLGRIGYTGRGINRRRAHLHFEINMLLSRHFDAWHDTHYRRSSNRHGIYNGLNLSGLDAAELFLAVHRDPTLSIQDFIAQQKPFFHVVVPDRGALDLLYRYPWLLYYDAPRTARAWEITFTQTGLPIRVVPSHRAVTAPDVLMVMPAGVRYDYITNQLGGVGKSYYLTTSGRRYVDLLTEPGPGLGDSGSTY